MTDSIALPGDPDDEQPDLTHEVMDEADQAAIFQQNENDQALAKIKAKLAPETHPDFDGKHCVDCSDLIPKARLKMGKIRCVHCQSVLETRSKLYAPRGD